MSLFRDRLAARHRPAWEEALGVPLETLLAPRQPPKPKAKPARAPKPLRTGPTNASEPPIGPCAICGTMIVRRNASQKYCASCQAEGRRKRQREYYKAEAEAARAPRPCAFCGKTFTPARRDIIYCGQRCGNRAAELRKGKGVWLCGCGGAMQASKTLATATGRVTRLRRCTDCGREITTAEQEVEA